jgi:hypothetical protein
MKRKLAVLLLVALVALIAATPALAAGRSRGNERQYGEGGSPERRQIQQYFSLVGVITALDGDTITVEVYHGNRIIRPYIGGELTIKLTSSTRYRQWTSDGCIPISFDDLEVGGTTSIQGTVSGGAFIADRITVDVPMLRSRS